MLFRTLPRHCCVVLRQTLSALVISCSSGTALLPIPSVCSSFGALAPPNFAAACPALLRFRSSAFHRAMAYAPSSHFYYQRYHPIAHCLLSLRFVHGCLHQLITITKYSNRISASSNYSQTRHCRATALPLRLPIAGCRLLAAAADGPGQRTANPPAPKKTKMQVYL